MFYLLEENEYLDSELTEKMVKAVGFRNLVVHEYGKVGLKQVFEVAQSNIDAFVKSRHPGESRGPGQS